LSSTKPVAVAAAKCLASNGSDPGRFAFHKLIVSALRDASHALKAEKDRRQAAVLIAALVEQFPDWLMAAAGDLEESARPGVAMAAAQVLNREPRLTERARDFLSDWGGQG